MSEEKGFFLHLSGFSVLENKMTNFFAISASKIAHLNVYRLECEQLKPFFTDFLVVKGFCNITQSLVAETKALILAANYYFCQKHPSDVLSRFHFHIQTPTKIFCCSLL